GGVAAVGEVGGHGGSGVAEHPRVAAGAGAGDLDAGDAVAGSGQAADDGGGGGALPGVHGGADNGDHRRVVAEAEGVEHGVAAQVERDAFAVGEQPEGFEGGGRGHVGVAAGDRAGDAAGGHQVDAEEVDGYGGLVLVGGVPLAECEEQFVSWVDDRFAS